MSEKSPPTLGDIIASFGRQAAFCRQRDADETADIVDAAAENLKAGGVLSEFVEDFVEDPGRSALALRVVAALRYARKAEPGPSPDWRRALEAAVEGRPEVFADFISRPPQTNEIARIGALLPGFLKIAEQTGLPLDLYELGTSAGLLLGFDQFSVDYGSWRWGEGPLLASEWRGDPPTAPAPIKIGRRWGCDRDPVDLADPPQADRMRAYIWPEIPGRIRNFEAACAAAGTLRIRRDRADASTWLAGVIKEFRSDAVSVVFHSIFSIYLSGDEKNEIHASLSAAGAAATASAPVALLSFEPAEAASGLEFFLDLTIWPGGARERLARAHPHGAWVELLKEASDAGR